MAVANPDKPIRIFRNNQYPINQWYLLASLIFFVGCCQHISNLRAKFSKRAPRPSNADAESSESAVASSISIRRLPTAIINVFRILAFRCTLNFGDYSLNLAEVALTCLYIVSLFVWDFINTTDLSGNKLAIMYWTNRTAVLALSQLPLITALSMKNNIISIITRVSYDKLNYLHRMCARVVFVLIWTHVGSKVSCFFMQAWLHAGMLGVTAFSLLILVSTRPIRARQYEFFFYTHVLMVLIIMISVYYHAKEFGFTKFVWPSFIIWGLDRLIRGIRIVIYNFYNSGANPIDAKTEVVSKHFVRLTLKRPPHFHWSPGQTAFLITPGVSHLPFESHPFTIASYDASGTVSSATDSSPPSQEKIDTGNDYWKELVFLVNVRGGFTHRLAQSASKNGNIKAVIDGPYGPSPDLSRFNTSVFVAGGSGVSYTLPVFLKAISQVREGKSSCTRIVFIWALRDASHLRWISDALYHALSITPPGLTVQILIYLTGTAASLPSSTDWDRDSVSADSTGGVAASSTDVKLSATSLLLGLPSVVMNQGRPELSKLLEAEADCTRGGCMSVDVCGSRSMARTVQTALRFRVAGPSRVLRGAPSVTLHVESFGYA
ncbi:ferric reductase NAD binding domain-containing protein [Mycena floridula]|nr:ferric reductase NAD binding domain-containing protein [Mycena floridula]